MDLKVMPIWDGEMNMVRKKWLIKKFLNQVRVD